jgi:7,8-dihydro-6-hydroxymethylpterin-pyrophosphokinase
MDEKNKQNRKAAHPKPNTSSSLSFFFHVNKYKRKGRNKQNQFSPMCFNILTTFLVNKYLEETKSIEKRRKQTNFK